MAKRGLSVVRTGGLMLAAGLCLVAVITILVTPAGSYAAPQVMTLTPTPEEDELPATQPAADGPPVELLPPLTDEQLLDLLPQPDDLAPVFGENLHPQVSPANINDTLDGLRAAWPAAADRLEAIATTYGWGTSVRLVYNACYADHPASIATFEVDQLPSPALARQFIDDPQVRGYFVAMFFTLDEASTVHGWFMTSPPRANGRCYDQEVLKTLVFEYWGLLFSVEVRADAEADPAEVHALIEGLVPCILTKVNTVDALAGSTLAPTPVPAGTPAAITDLATLDRLAQAMPALADLPLAPDLYVLNPVSGTHTLDAFVAAYYNLGLAALGDAIALAGQTNGMIGQETRVWNTGSTCPDVETLGIEVDIALFETAEGARGYMTDAAVQQAWLDTGLITGYTPQEDTMVVLGYIPDHRCGPAILVEKIVPYERLLITVAVTARSQADQPALLDLIDTITGPVISNVNLATWE